MKDFPLGSQVVAGWSPLEKLAKATLRVNYSVKQTISEFLSNVSQLGDQKFVQLLPCQNMFCGVSFQLERCTKLVRKTQKVNTSQNPVLRLFTGVVLEPVAGVDVLATGTSSGSESDSWTFAEFGRFLLSGAITLNISLWFSASILVKSVMISLLKDVFISSRFSGSILGFLLGPAIRFSLELFRLQGFRNLQKLVLLLFFFSDV